GGRLGDYILLAVFATFAVCTKDQAYGLYALMPAAIVFQNWRTKRLSGSPRPLAAALTDRRLLAAGVTSVVLFTLIHTLLFNMRGFVAHVQFLVGPGIGSYRMFTPTVSGRVTLAVLTLHILRASLGWPLFGAAVAGLALGTIAPALRRTTAYLFLPVVSYYFSFINVILYNYDRFLLPILVVAAL